MMHSKKKPRRFVDKIQSPAALSKILQRSKNQKIVFTNGCFDLLHKGHVTYLEKAKRLGDCLVVALNDDFSVRKLKGPTRPVNALGDRLEVIAALESVDYVTWFKEETPLQVILALEPDVLVKGGDWTPSQIVGAKEVRSRGGRVRTISFVPGRSTTRMIQKVNQRK